MEDGRMSLCPSNAAHQRQGEMALILRQQNA
jgi:hypothetical protein